MKRLQKSIKKNSKITFSVENSYADAMYFPSKKFLEEIRRSAMIEYKNK